MPKKSAVNFSERYRELLGVEKPSKAELQELGLTKKEFFALKEQEKVEQMKDKAYQPEVVYDEEESDSSESEPEPIPISPKKKRAPAKKGGKKVVPPLELDQPELEEEPVRTKSSVRTRSTISKSEREKMVKDLIRDQFSSIKNEHDEFLKTQIGSVKDSLRQEMKLNELQQKINHQMKGLVQF